MKARAVVGRGEKSLLRDPGPELRLGRENNKNAPIINWISKVTIKKIIRLKIVRVRAVGKNDR